MAFQSGILLADSAVHLQGSLVSRCIVNQKNMKVGVVLPVHGRKIPVVGLAFDEIPAC